MNIKLGILKTMVKFNPAKNKRMVFISGLYGLLRLGKTDRDELQRLNTIMGLSDSYGALKYPMGLGEAIWKEGEESGMALPDIYALNDNLSDEHIKKVWFYTPKWLRYTYSDTEKDIRTLISTINKKE